MKSCSPPVRWLPGSSLSTFVDLARAQCFIFHIWWAHNESMSLPPLQKRLLLVMLHNLKIPPQYQALLTLGSLSMLSIQFTVLE